MYVLKDIIRSLCLCVNSIYLKNINNIKLRIMANKESKILDELRRRGTIFEDPCPKSEGFIGKLIDLFSKKKS